MLIPGYVRLLPVDLQVQNIRYVSACLPINLHKIIHVIANDDHIIHISYVIRTFHVMIQFIEHHIRHELARERSDGQSFRVAVYDDIEQPQHEIISKVTAHYPLQHVMIDAMEELAYIDSVDIYLIHITKTSQVVLYALACCKHSLSFSARIRRIDEFPVKYRFDHAA